jgi:hypothetical protein
MVCSGVRICQVHRKSIRKQFGKIKWERNNETENERINTGKQWSDKENKYNGTEGRQIRKITNQTILFKMITNAVE